MNVRPQNYDTKPRGRDRSGQLAYDWTPEAVARLIELKRAGYSHTQAAKAMGCSRSKISGKVNRLKRDGVDFARAPCAKVPTFSTISTTAVLGTFLERLCDIGSW